MGVGWIGVGGRCQLKGEIQEVGKIDTQKYSYKVNSQHTLPEYQGQATKQKLTKINLTTICLAWSLNSKQQKSRLLMTKTNLFVWYTT